MEARQFWDTLEILLILIVRFFFVLLLSFTWRSPAWRRLGCPEEAEKEIFILRQENWILQYLFSQYPKHYRKYISKMGIKSKKITFRNLLWSSCFWKQDTRCKRESVTFINHIRILLWNFLVWLFPQKSTQWTFESRPEHKANATLSQEKLFHNRITSLVDIYSKANLTVFLSFSPVSYS